MILKIVAFILPIVAVVNMINGDLTTALLFLVLASTARIEIMLLERKLEP